jgi:hypothetical protein
VGADEAVVVEELHGDARLRRAAAARRVLHPDAPGMKTEIEFDRN